MSANSPEINGGGAETTEFDEVLLLREQVDALDLVIQRFIIERTRFSKRIQQARVNSGGARIELGREKVIRESYQVALGRAGLQVADAVLEVGRGPVRPLANPTAPLENPVA